MFLWVTLTAVGAQLQNSEDSHLVTPSKMHWQKCKGYSREYPAHSLTPLFLSPPPPTPVTPTTPTPCYGPFVTGKRKAYCLSWRVLWRVLFCFYKQHFYDFCLTPPPPHPLFKKILFIHPATPHKCVQSDPLVRYWQKLSASLRN